MLTFLLLVIIPGMIFLSLQISFLLYSCMVCGRVVVDYVPVSLTRLIGLSPLCHFEYSNTFAKAPGWFFSLISSPFFSKIERRRWNLGAEGPRRQIAVLVTRNEGRAIDCVSGRV